ncbi:MAG: Gfo/Idh/MocA family oxidoreductase [Clostridium sp.]|nr:Gfo/Idh/MocA family oxidoreductase [Clostridium sp.]
MKKTVIVGYGNMGSKYAARIYNGEIRDLSLYGIVCRNAPGQQKIRESMPEVAIFPDEDSMFAECEKFDALIITTPHKEHVRVVKKAQQAGLHVLCEKPLGVTAKECREVTADMAASVCATIFNWRARDIYREVHDYLADGKLGRLHQVVWTANFWYRPECYHKASAWRSSWQGEGGGLLINQSQHLLDMWNWLFGQPCEVSAQIGYGQYNNIQVDDKVSLFFKHENGMWGTFISSTGDAPGTNRLEIHGEMGKLIVEDNKYISLYQNEASTVQVSKTSQDMYEKIPFREKKWEVEQKKDEYTVILQNFADAVEGREEPLATFLDGCKAIENTNAAYLSDWQHSAVTIPCNDEKYCQELEKRML